jgi:creatinine amidohydrolase
VREHAEWHRLTAAEVTERLAGGAIVLWPIGATEQHGPHLATGFDHLAAEHVVGAAAARLLPQVLVLPTFALGCSPHWVALGGTISLSHESLFHVMRDVCQSAERAGAGHVVIVNGHMGNVPTGLAVLSEFVESELTVEFVSYWDLIDPQLLGELVRDGAGVGHAGEFETSIALAMGELVREESVPPAPNSRPWATGDPGSAAVRRPIDAARDTVGGVVGTASDATAELGTSLLDAAVDGLVAHCLVSGSRAGSPGRRRRLE